MGVFLVTFAEEKAADVTEFMLQFFLSPFDTFLELSST